jgi:hypothetical protein
VTPAERCANAVAAGKYKSVEAWCAAVIVSQDSRIPPAWRKWASRQLDEAVGNRSWVWLLDAKRDRGDRLMECQARAIKQVLGDEGRIEETSASVGDGGQISE